MLNWINNNYKVKLFSICLLAVMLILLCFAFMSREISQYKASVIAANSVTQEEMLKSVSADIRDIFESEETKENAEAAAANLLAKQETSASRYWFLYKETSVIFERDSKETIALRDKSILEMISYWKLSGGVDADRFLEIVEGSKTGTVLFTKNVKLGTEIVTVRPMKTDDETYYLGIATRLDYVMNTERVSEHVLYLYIFCAAASVALAIAALGICLIVYRNQKVEGNLEGSLTNRNIQIEELTRKLDVKSEAVQNASIYDSLTKLYNRKFFDNLLYKLKNELLMPVSLCVFDINGLAQINEEEGYGAGDILLEQFASILKRVCIDTDVIARTGSSEFTILMIGTKESEAYGMAESIIRQYYSLDDTKLSLSLGISEMKETITNIFMIAAEARKNLMQNKMLDRNSNNNYIIRMLMETLDAYSEKTVSHCNRMRDIAIDFGSAIGMSPVDLTRLAVGAQLHDIGKIGIPDSVLNKKERLTEDEKSLVRMHSEVGYRIVNAIPDLEDISIDILQHHEAYDGTGYPAGLVGEEITCHARILKVIDSFDAMTNHSVYSSTKSVTEAIEELKSNSGKQYDPYIVNEFVKRLEAQIEEAHRLSNLESAEKEVWE